MGGIDPAAFWLAGAALVLGLAGTGLRLWPKSAAAESWAKVSFVVAAVAGVIAATLFVTAVSGGGAEPSAADPDEPSVSVDVDAEGGDSSSSGNSIQQGSAQGGSVSGPDEDRAGGAADGPPVAEDEGEEPAETGRDSTAGSSPSPEPEPVAVGSVIGSPTDGQSVGHEIQAEGTGSGPGELWLLVFNAQSNRYYLGPQLELDEAGSWTVPSLFVGAPDDTAPDAYALHLVRVTPTVGDQYREKKASERSGAVTGWLRAEVPPTEWVHDVDLRRA